MQLTAEYWFVYDFLQLSRLEIDEAVLTGESVPVIKTLPALPAPEDKDQDVAVGDRTNMAFRQTSVSQGSGKGMLRIRRQPNFHK